ncbi:MAG: alpha/beta fold hydrolase [Acidimicrobiales bacterium]
MSEPISFERSGRGPAVVLLHPTGIGPAPLTPLAERLRRRHLVVLPARRGYAGSEGLTPPTSMGDQLDDLAARLDHLGLTSATFVGISGGATLVLALAIRFPELVDGGLAHEPLIGPLAPGLHAAVRGAIEAMLADHSSMAVSTFIAELIGVEMWNRLAPAWRDDVERYAAATCAEAPFYPTFAPTGTQLAALGRLGVVTSVGARSGPLRHEAADVLASLGLPRRVIAGAAHLAHLEAPEAFAELVDALPRRAGVAR